MVATILNKLWALAICLDALKGDKTVEALHRVSIKGKIIITPNRLKSR